MPSTTCIIIDFVTGESWEVPVYLYEKFVNESSLLHENGETIVQQWLDSLPEEEKGKVHKQ